jgi:hypothetical protein
MVDSFDGGDAREGRGRGVLLVIDDWHSSIIESVEVEVEG